MATRMKDIAEKLDLSINAVSLALNNKSGVSEGTRNLVVETAEAMGYLSQKQNKRYRNTFASKHIGVLMVKRNYKTRFYTRILYGMEKKVNDLGYYLVMKFLDDDSLWNALEEQKFCGLIVVGVVAEETLRRIAEYGLPTVLVDNASYDKEFDCILSDNRMGTFESVRYLLNSGCRKIGFFGDFAYSHSNRERYWGYLEALMGECHNLARVNEIASTYSIIGQIDDCVLRHDVDAVIRLLQDKPIAEAYQCANDTSAVVLVNALRTLGRRIPEDVSVIGFDDEDYASLSLPPLTTLHVHMVQMGGMGVERLLWRISHPDKPTCKTLLPVEFILRNSTSTINRKE